MPDICKKAPLMYAVEEFTIIASLTIFTIREST